MKTNRILVGDCRRTLQRLPDSSAHCCVTSPPYWGLRDYKSDDQIGLEKTPERYVRELVAVFRGVYRVLRDDGTLWLNLGDSYATFGGSGKQGKTGQRAGRRHTADGSLKQRVARGGNVPQTKNPNCTYPDAAPHRDTTLSGLKPKDLVGIPWMVAFALRADGWHLRQDIIWHKPAPMPESVTDRCTKAHEYLFLLAKSPRYYYDAFAISDRSTHAGQVCKQGEKSLSRGQQDGIGMPRHGNALRDSITIADQRNKRSVWTVNTQPFKGAHFATFPKKLITPCILAGTSGRGCCGRCGAPWVRQTKTKKLKRKRPNDVTKRNGTTGTGNHCPNTVAGVAVKSVGWVPTCVCGGAVVPCVVLDPFFGAGTVGVVCKDLGRSWVGCESNPEYAQMAESRINRVRVGFDLF